MEILSSAKSLKCISFPDLSIKAVHRPDLKDAESLHFEFFNRTKYFFTLSKSFGLELFRIGKSKQSSSGSDGNNPSYLQSCKRYRLDNVSCIGCPRKSLNEVAIGMDNGFVKLYDFRTSMEFTKKINPDRINNSVLHIDFNAQDEYMSTVYENGTVSIYGVNTGIKVKCIETFKIPTLARFHPIKRFHLAVGTLSGGVSITDAQTAKQVFRYKEAHMAPMRDLAMCPESPDTLITVGYDCLINIFDTRDKSARSKNKTTHPLNCCTLSDCGKFLCVGTLKGELISYDVRNLSTEYGMANVHDDSICRLQFITGLESKNVRASLHMEARSRQSVSSVDVAVSNNEYSSVMSSRRPTKRDSFDDIFDIYGANACVGRSSSINKKSTESSDDSFLDWDNFNRNINDMPQLRLSTAPRRGRSSCVPDQAVIVEDERESGELSNYLNDNQSRLNNFHPDGNENELDTKPSLNDSRNITLRRPKITSTQSEQFTNALESKTNGEYKQSQSMVLANSNDGIFVTAKSDDDKENVSINRRFQTHSTRKSTLPTVREGVPTSISSSEFNLLIEKMNELDVNIKQMQTNVNDEMKNLKWNLSRVHWDVISKLYTSTFNLLKEPTKSIEEIRQSVELMINDNTLVQEIYRLREESANLRQQLDLMKNSK